jgi:hypothetical protein
VQDQATLIVDFQAQFCQWERGRALFYAACQGELGAVAGAGKTFFGQIDRAAQVGADQAVSLQAI